MAYEGLEPCVGKLTSTVLMGLEPSNRLWVPDFCQFSATSEGFFSEIIGKKNRLGNTYIEAVIHR